MIYTENLEQVILNRHKHNHADELIILSGWTGASPVQKISREKIKTTIIQGIKSQLNKQLLRKYVQISSQPNIDILVSPTYNHSKIYCWMRDNSPIDILAGSANLSTQALNSRVKGETLFDLDKGDYTMTFKYLNEVLKQCKHSSKVTIKGTSTGIPTNFKASPKRDTVLSFNPPKAEIYLGDSNGRLHKAGGLNWGHGKAHVGKDCAYFPLRTDLINAIPALFPNSGINPQQGAGHGHKNKKADAEFLFDDGEVIDISFEATGGPSIVNPDQKTFKQCSSYPKNNILGRYIRKRLGLQPTAFITEADVTHYGRDTITLELISPGVYYCDFSV